MTKSEKAVFQKKYMGKKTIYTEQHAALRDAIIEYPDYFKTDDDLL